MMDIAYRLFEKKNDYTAFSSVGDMICPFDINGELTRLSCSDASGMTEFDNRIVVHSANPSGKIHELMFSYHPGQPDSASWITDSRGVAVRHIQYLPYGEPYINQRLSGYNERFTFTGKEQDSETGYGYFGARYMDHELMMMWLSVDPKADKYHGISPYAYCAWNPMRLVDPDGREVHDWKHNAQTGDLEVVSVTDNYHHTVEIIGDGEIRTEKHLGQLSFDRTFDENGRLTSCTVAGSEDWQLNSRKNDCAAQGPLNISLPNSEDISELVGPTIAIGNVVCGATSGAEDVQAMVKSEACVLSNKFTRSVPPDKVASITKDCCYSAKLAMFGRFAGATVGYLGVGVEAYLMSQNPTTGNYLRFAISSVLTTACIFPGCQPVAVPLSLAWGFVDTVWGGELFDF